jgi:DNA modification methylase
MTAIVLRGDAASLPLPGASVDLVVTSPPYFGLRSYTDGGVHYAGQIGDEPTPAEYLDALTACTAEWMRVLKPGGSLFVNLGDKYARTGGTNKTAKDYMFGNRMAPRKPTKVPEGIPGKSLMGLPWRYAIRCIDELGLILRAEIIWSKPNGLPESVTDRVRRSHEQVFHLVKQPRYYTAVDEIREEAGNYRGAQPAPLAQRVTALKVPGNVPMSGTALAANPLGKLPGSVWSIPTAPLAVPDHLGVDHFAAFPPELVRRIVLGWSPREVCTACGEGRRPVTSAEPVTQTPRRVRLSIEQRAKGPTGGGGTSYLGATADERARQITGYVCACPDTTAPTTRGMVLDPFGGTGTTALVASCYGRVGISVDLSADYCRLARWRTTDPGERARVLRQPPPKRSEQTGEATLF